MKKGLEFDLIEMFGCGNDNEYVVGERVEYLWEDEEFNDLDNYSEEFVNGWNELKDRLKGGMIVNKEFLGDINFELVGEDILMWFIEESEY